MDCSLCLTPMTVQGKEFAIFLSLALQWQLVLDGVGYQRMADGYQITKATAAGQAQAIQKWPFDMPAVISMLPGKLGGILSFNGAAEVISLAAAEMTSAKLEKVYFADWQEIGVDEADVVVAGGNGMQNQAQFQELAALGQLLSAPVGGSRVAEDKGWIPPVSYTHLDVYKRQT